MTSRKAAILKIALPVPLRRCFDYLISESLNDIPLKPGMRVKVPFGKSKKLTGIILGISDESDLPRDKLKNILALIDHKPLFGATHLKFLDWAGNYYQHPVGETYFSTLPAAIRQGKPVKKKLGYTWELTRKGEQVSLDEFKRAPRQSELVRLLRSGTDNERLSLLKDKKWNPVIQALQDKGIIREVLIENQGNQDTLRERTIALNQDQQKAIDVISQGIGKPERFLLYGVTGSGKTEVYLEVIRKVIGMGRQALILVPEIGLTPQLVQRIKDGIGAEMAVLHSSRSDGERLQGWIAARDGEASIILGTRSAIWTPLKNPGVFIVDEEHDLSYKQQEGFRYSARDVAIMRAKMTGSPIILGSATPSMEALQNVERGNYQALNLKSRAGKSQHPVISLIDMRAGQMSGALSDKLVRAISGELEKNHQILLFLNQRGFSPVIMCHSCGWIARCRRCEVHMIYHKSFGKYVCHHCGSQSPLPENCPECDSNELLQIGHGTERLAETLAEIFPGARILRIDRDSTRKKYAMEKMIDTINTGKADILIGTQMLAKGHHFPKLTLVGIIDSDRGLFSSDFRGSERMMQLFLQVSGRAGRAEKEGRVLVQTHYPEHPLIQAMIKQDYNEFSRLILRERQQTNLPPFSYLVLLRAEDYQLDAVNIFLHDARNLLESDDRLIMHGPVPAIMEKRAGRIRYQLIIQSNDRNHMRNVLGPWSRSLESLRSAARVRWSIDVDPQEMF